MSDGYALYNGIAHEQLVHLGCWSHARRGFIKAEEAIPKAVRSPAQLATRFVTLIAKLYAAEARSAKWDAGRRRRLRVHYTDGCSNASSSCAFRIAKVSCRAACWGRHCST
jgi:transposase